VEVRQIVKQTFDVERLSVALAVYAAQSDAATIRLPIHYFLACSMVSRNGSFTSVSPDASLSSDDLISGSSFPPDYLSQCLRAFRDWHDSLDTRSDRFNGSLVAIPEIESETGVVCVATTNVVKSEEPQHHNTIYFGVKGTMASLVHGSVVALYNRAHDGFMSVNSLGPLNRLPKSGQLFLVVDLGNHHFSFYSILNDRLVGFSHGDGLFGCFPVRDLSSVGISDNEFIAEIPSAAVFVVRPELRDGTMISVYSKCAKAFFHRSRYDRPRVHRNLTERDVSNSRSHGRGEPGGW
jgi:hypothetical protein